jgi:LmbE family N-acetylglucosaminyl deacetylase
MDTVALLKVAQAIEAVINEIKPQVVYTHHQGDLNIDHVLTSRAVLTAGRPLPGSSVQEIYGFEVLSSTEWSPSEVFVPMHFVNIDKFYPQKADMLKAYDAEMRPYPHARSYECAEAQAVLRGGQSGVKQAEAFTVLRSIRL